MKFKSREKKKKLDFKRLWHFRYLLERRIQQAGVSPIYFISASKSNFSRPSTPLVPPIIILRADILAWDAWCESP